MKKLTSIVSIIAVLLLALAAWYFLGSSSASQDAGNGDGGDAMGGMPAMPPMPVPMYSIEKQQAEIWQTYPAKIEAINYAQVRPQVSGEITQIKFDAGAEVEAGQVLMTIDTRALRDQLNVAKANLALAQSSLDLASNNFERAKRLITTKAISQKAFDERQADYNRAKSSIALSKAQVNQANTNLNYAYIRAPFSGRISRAEVTEGNVVQAGPTAPVLFSILSSDGVYIDFDVDEKTYLQHISANEDLSNVQLQVQLASTTAPAINAQFLHYDNAVNGSSGTIRTRGIITESNSGLLPGMSVKVSMSLGNAQPHIIIPETAIGVDQSRRFVWVVGDDNIVQYRPVGLGSSVSQGRIVLSGLNTGETIVADGLIKIRPNTKVMDISQLPPPEAGAASQ